MSFAKRVASFGALVCAAALAASCGETELPPFGDLASPVAIAVHQPSGQALIASQDGDELRVFDIPRQRFLGSPSISFPLSIPTVKTPRHIAAGARFVFVVSGADGSVGFVDTDMPEGAFGPRSVVDEEGALVSLRPTFATTDAVAFASPYEGPEGIGDHLLLVGLADGETGGIAAVRPPVGAGAPELVFEVDLPGARPVGVALEEGFATEEDDFADCRTLAIADSGASPGIWITKAQVDLEGNLTVAPPAAEDKIEVEVEVTLADGSQETRVAPVRAVAFAPVPPNVSLPEAVAASPCETRSGRIFALLDMSYCGGTVSCPNFVAIDLPSGELARDAVLGGPAAYQLPAVPLELLSLEGPMRVSEGSGEGADPTTERIRTQEEGPSPIRVSEEVGPILGLTLITSSDGGVTYVAGGTGTRLLGPTETRRLASDPVFLLDANPGLPGLQGQVTRTDRRGVALPRLHFPVRAQPRNETWTAGFEIPLPGLEGVGLISRLDGASFTLPAGSQRSFRGATPLLVGGDPELADRLVPQAQAPLVCDGFPLTSISEDGRTVTVALEAPGFVNDEGCSDEEAALSLSVLPPKGLPWTLEGSSSGFVGRVEADPDRVSAIAFGDRLLFEFQPPEEEVERGATYTWTTTTGFRFFRHRPANLSLPASIAAYAVRPPSNWRIVVGYSGSDAITVWDPRVRPAGGDRFLFR